MTTSTDRRTTARPARRRHLLRWVVLVLALLMIVPGVSYARALTYPGSATVEVRTIEWLADHGGRGAVNAIENWVYSRHAPPRVIGPGGTPPLPSVTGAAPSAPLNRAPFGPLTPDGQFSPSVPLSPHAPLVPTGPSAVPPPPTSTPAGAPAPLPVLAGHPALPGEGAWQAGRTDRTGRPALFTTFIRPDAQHPGVVAGVARFVPGRTAVHLVAGTREPQGARVGAAAVPSSDVPDLVATFNSGWRTMDAPGGFYIDGAGAPTLTPGLASAVIDDHGRVTVGQWGRDVTMTPHVRAVRQNLRLIVDGGAPVPGLARNYQGSWGSPNNQFQYTWRSGLGNDAHGDLIYVAGNDLTLQTLAQALVEAGVQRGMELDIHSPHVSFTGWYGTGAAARPRMLLPDLPSSTSKYLVPDQRDFFYVTQVPR
ncbi:hypothetical protein ATJ97_1853 [Georgenia soli]|uniref:Phosphodiester glycosidase domain-containing protein n=1 Tax=Georgenia soli TaxID=638953 RepID=A0A2A9EM94_9MICO|nr:hypothetical protein [Georgenia soli]PFG39350.1 hypothetical protein ATJ97_1853 [Georgenia soli]